MTRKNVIRLMGEEDLFDVPDAREEFEMYGTEADRLFFVIEDDNKKVIGYLMAQTEDYKVFIRKMQLSSTLEQREKELYRKTVVSNLYHYVEQIKNCAGKKIFFQVFLSNEFKKSV